MNRKFVCGSLTTAALCSALIFGCESDESRLTPATRKVAASRPAPVAPGEAKPPAQAKESEDFTPPPFKDEAPQPTASEATVAKLGPNVYLEKEGKDKRRVLVNAYVCRREGQLEQLLCRRDTKEHEAILVADIDARTVHAALLVAEATPGQPVKFQPVYTAATGQPIKVTLRFEQNGRLVTVPAQQWIRNMKTNKDLEHNWVFAGSLLINDPCDPTKKIYLANDGDVICVSNFETAMLDLPINSPKEEAELAFEPATKRIPPKNTKVTVILEPIPEKKE